MAFVMTTTTESAEALQQGASDNWKTAPEAPVEPPDPGAVPKEIPQKIFNSVREEQIREKQKTPEWLREDRGKPDEAIKKYETAKQRDYAAERHKAELRKILEQVSGERVSDESQSSESRPNAEQNGNGNAAPSDDFERSFKAASRVYHDFDAAIAGVKVTQRLIDAIRAQVKNPAEVADIAYTLAKSPGLREELENDPSSSNLAKISPTIRHKIAFDAHSQRMAADPAAARAVATSNVVMHQAVLDAIVEEDNSSEVAKYFAENPSEAEALNELPPVAAVAKVGRVAERLSAKSAARQRTRPLPPISPVGGSSTRSGGSLEELSPGDYIRARNKQEFERKRFGR